VIPSAAVITSSKTSTSARSPLVELQDTRREPLHGGAATWPGAGVNATSGYLAAKEVVRKGALRNRLVKAGPRDRRGGSACPRAARGERAVGVANGITAAVGAGDERDLPFEKAHNFLPPPVLPGSGSKGRRGISALSAP